MKIGLIGISFCNSNKGVCALAYASLCILDKISVDSKTEFEYYVFSGKEEKQEEVERAAKEILKKDVKIEVVRLDPFTDRKCRKNLFAKIKECDTVVDMTGGDSFSDIYGARRFLYRTFLKKIIIKKSSLILGPQTIGPFKKKIFAFIAAKVVKKSKAVMARDDISAKYTTEKLKRRVNSLIDVAFFLPYEKAAASDKKVGFNVSSLLWNGGYTGDNQFDLKMDYKAFVRGLINALRKEGYEIHLIPHVIVDSDYDSVENDVKINDILKTEFPFVVTAPAFKTPIEAKSYISGMDVFIGSRMHATIGAVSSGVKTIPVSYSRKFEGLFGTIKYPVSVDAKSLDEKSAIEKTLCYVKDENGEVLSSLKTATEEIETRKKRLLEEMTVAVTEKPSRRADFYKKYCTGCGACTNFGIKTVKNEKGFYYPIVKGKEDEKILSGLCRSAGYPDENISSDKKEEKVFGKFRQAVFGWSRDESLRKAASSGGAVTAVTEYLLSNKKVDGAIVTGNIGGKPYSTDTVIVYDKNELRNFCGSRYSVSSPLKDLIKKIDLNKKYVFIGKPCDVEAVNRMFSENSGLRDSIVLTVAFFCAGIPSDKANEKLIKELSYGADLKDIESLTYRGNGWPGEATVKLSDGAQKTMLYEKAWGEILGRDTASICKFCFDGVGESADIACGDAWYVKDGKPDFTENKGRNIIFARTEKGEEVLSDAERKGFIETEKVSDLFSYLKVVQKWQYTRKTTMKSKIAAMKITCKKAPKISKKSLKVAGKFVGIKTKAKIFYGTVKRSIKGKL